MKELDIENWERKGIYDMFRHLDFPFYNVAFRVDVTSLKQYTKVRELSFYYSLVYLVVKAANSIENFRLRFIDGKIYDIGDIVPSLTFLKKGSEAFQVVNCSLTPSLDEYTDKVKFLTDSQSVFLGGENYPEQQLIYVSCLPWIDMMSSSSEHFLNPDDAIPRIAWGKYIEGADGRLTLGMSVDANHKVVDGYHIGKLYERLQQMIDGLEIKRQ